MAGSEFRLQPLHPDEHPDRIIIAGWHPRYHTYFAQIFDGYDSDGEEIVVLNIPSPMTTIVNSGDVIDAVRPYAEIPDDFPTRLKVSVVADTVTFADLRPESSARVDVDHIQENNPMATTEEYLAANPPFGGDSSLHLRMEH